MDNTSYIKRVRTIGDKLSGLRVEFIDVNTVSIKRGIIRTAHLFPDNGLINIVLELANNKYCSIDYRLIIKVI